LRVDPPSLRYGAATELSVAGRDGWPQPSADASARRPYLGNASHHVQPVQCPTALGDVKKNSSSRLVAPTCRAIAQRRREPAMREKAEGLETAGGGEPARAHHRETRTRIVIGFAWWSSNWQARQASWSCWLWLTELCNRIAIPWRRRQGRRG
jgi:hypothetical protein